MKNVLIDLTGLARQTTGIEYYTENLAKQLFQIDTINNYIAIFRKKVHDDFTSIKRGNLTYIVSPFKSQFLTEQIFLPWYALTHSFDFHFFPCFPPSVLIRNKLIIICYDTTFWMFPECTSLKAKLYFKPQIEVALKRAIKIITISESAKKDIIKYFPFAANKLVNIYTAISDDFKKIEKEKAKEWVKKYGISDKYLLCVGSLEPRKNIPFVLKSLAPFLKKNDLVLAIIGRKAWGGSEIEQIISQLGIQNKLVMTGQIPNLELRYFYSAAELFLFPSRYEGFGIPILEAFSCECPVVTSNTSSMPEVAGDAAVLIDPTNSEEFVAAVKKVLSDQALRKRLQLAGIERKKMYSWNKVARDFLNVINT